MRPALWICAALSAQTAPRKFRPFADEKPLARVPGLRWSEKAEDRTMYQVFTDAGTGKEVFRLDVGNRFGSEWVKYWLCGIVHRADYNGDGRIDYAWHGGDDTSSRDCILLSDPQGYRKLEVLSTLEQEWLRRHPKDRRDFHLLDFDFEVFDTVLESDNGVLSLTFRIRSIYKPKQPVRVVRVPGERFVFSAR